MFRYEGTVRQYRRRFSREWSALPRSVHGDDDTISTGQHTFAARDGSPIKVSYYRPKTAEAPFRTFIYVPGGGFLACDDKVYGIFAKRFCATANIQVLVIETRLAPENKFPVPIYDVIDGIQSILSHSAKLHVDPDHLILGGDSSGGYLALQSLLWERSLIDAFEGLLLISPVLDFSKSYADGQEDDPHVTEWSRDFLYKNFLPAVIDPQSPRVSPLFHPQVNVLAALRVHVLFGGVERLHGEISTFIKKCEAEDIAISHDEFPGLTHSCMWLHQHVVECVGKRLRQMFIEETI